MSTPSFFRRLVDSVAHPAERSRLERQAKRLLQLCHALLSERGEVSGAALARDALAAYDALPDTALPFFLDRLVEEFSPDPAQLDQAYAAYHADPSQENLVRLQRAVEPPRQELFRRLNTAPGGTALLVNLRRRLIGTLKARPAWRGIDADLAHLFASWFNRGFLTLERIDWQTPAIVLEKLIQYEAVHQITGWDDLRRRLENDRRCFAFFHPALPHEPLIFIEVALSRGMTSAIQPLLALDAPTLDPEQADTAIFYSITNCQEGLRGVSFGNLLIKQVAQRLGQEFPRIKTFATLSPIPGFREWLTAVADRLAEAPHGMSTLQALKKLDETDWHKDETGAESLRKVLMPLCACYLVNGAEGGHKVDSVARFHLGNGARLERINWLADTSSHAMQRSAGMMVNYLYRLNQVEENHEAYVRDHKVVASAEIRRLARECPLSPRRNVESRSAAAKPAS